CIIDFPRLKTGIPRHCPLWPETVAAITEPLANRPKPKKAVHAGLLFVTKYGQPWAKLSTDNTLAKEMGKLLKTLGINGRGGLGFYPLRHTFRSRQHSLPIAWRVASDGLALGSGLWRARPPPRGVGPADAAPVRRALPAPFGARPLPAYCQNGVVQP